MRATRWLWCIALVGCGLVASASAEQAVRWQVSLEAAKRLASQTNRLVLIHFWADWCQPCQEMEQQVFTQLEVTSAIEFAFVPVRINVDHFPHTRQQFGITVLPTEVIITPGGQLVGKIDGTADARKYAARLNQIAAAANLGGRGHQVAGPVARPAEARMPAPPQYGPAESTRPESAPPQPRTPPVGQHAGRVQPPDEAELSLVGPRYAGLAPPAIGSPPPSVPSVTIPPAVSGPRPNVPSATIPPAMSGPPPNVPSVTIPPTMSGRPPSVPSVTIPPARDFARSGSASMGPADQLAAPAARPAGVSQSPAPPIWRSEFPAGGPPPSMAQSPPPTVQLPAGNPPLGLDGYCPVELTEGKRWVAGDLRWGLIHRGRTYLFAGPQQRDRFDADPDRYAPAAAGNDVVLLVERGEVTPGRREHGGWFEGRVYLFFSPGTYARFCQAPEQYAAPAGEVARQPNMARRNPGFDQNRPVGGPAPRDLTRGWQ